MPRDDALTGDFQEDLCAVVADPHTADVFAGGLRDRFRHLQEVEARRLLDAEYRQPAELRRRRAVLRGEAIHRAFARLCAEADRERVTPMIQVAASWGERAQAERQLEALIRASRRPDAPASPKDAEATAEPRRRYRPFRSRRRAPATWEWAGARPHSTYDHMRLYHVPSVHMLLSNLIL